MSFCRKHKGLHLDAYVLMSNHVHVILKARNGDLSSVVRDFKRFIATTDEGHPIALNEAKIQEDARYDGYKALSTTTDLAVKDIIEKYSDLFEVEHTFRTLKSQIEIRPRFHWTDSRVRGHIAMCFIAFTFINHLKNTTGLQYSQIVKAIDKMQLSKIQDNKTSSHFYLRSQISDNQHVIINKLGLIVPNGITPQHAVNQHFT